MKQLLLIIFFLLSQSTFAETENKEFESKGLNEVSVENISGKVTVSAFEGAKASVVATKNKFSDKCKMSIDRSGNKLVLKVEKSGGVFSSDECDVDFEVKVPKAVDLSLNVGSGNMIINGIHGALNFKVGSGNTSADGSFKKIDGMSGSGNVTVKGLNGGGGIKTGSGEINLTFTNKSLKGELDLKAGSGNATLLFPKGSKVKTNFFAGSGQVSNELGDNPNALFLVSMKAGSGNLKIKSY
ncbi:MAG: DUF4097 family beta strand repeat-containing protein [Bdellovibrionota bacterium]